LFRSQERKKTSWEHNVELIWQGIAKAFELVFSFDAEVWAITWLSIKISGGATLISLFLGIPLGIVLALATFPGRSVAVALINTGMGLPPVVVGLFVSIFLWRSGPLGFLDLIYSPTAMVVAQVVIAFPIVAGLTMASFQSLDPKLGLQLLGIGASTPQLLWLLCKEARLPLLAAVMAGFGGVISEVGASMMVGGNIRGQTRVLTTATVLETGKGNFDVAIALGVILLGLTFAINFCLTHMQQRGQLRWPRPS
jgi:tungstate transport system permease protein